MTNDQGHLERAVHSVNEPTGHDVLRLVESNLRKGEWVASTENRIFSDCGKRTAASIRICGSELNRFVVKER